MEKILIMSSVGLKIVVLVSGRGSNLQAILDAKAAGQISSEVSCVVSNKADAMALTRAKEAQIPTKVVPSKGVSKDEFHQNLLQTVQSLKPDLVVLAGFMRILPADFIRAFENRIINIHPSLLPAFPGLNSHQQALDAGVKLTGCTVHFVDEGCDTGPIILQSPVDILYQDDEAKLSARLLPIEHATLVKAIKLLEDHKVVLQGNKTLLRTSI